MRGGLLMCAVLAASTARAEDEGKRLFTTVTPACALCHALKDAGAEGAVGPSLDELRPDHDRVVKALRTGIGAMPPFTHLSEAQIQALARYVSAAAR